MKVSAPTLTTLIAQLASLPGLRGCALVDADAGFVWGAQGELAHRHGLWEAATDFWRLQTRHAAHFADLGQFGGAVMHHTAGMLVVFPCCREPALLCVAVGREGAVDWINLQRKAASVGRLIAAGVEPPALPISSTA
jgi:hypothetical protein